MNYKIHCFGEIHFSIASNSSQLQMLGIACCSTDIIVSASLTSFELDEEITLDCKTLQSTAAEIFSLREIDDVEI
ncbi:hypothetical protein L6164_011713 [Bauhinia variegata]|uniref:Uncharacterized protein n=1 Tax=Bauhinia variegata TaxID=167791 RepID=A0ACB9P7N8_BAUVA|nr:hypothetical protein L6164_011713 [Bauhinia variegata]